jgi:hypothetical protein
MKLAPRNPPGRVTRKARAFTAEILQLRDQGYTFEAIRAALADAGVHVSSSTVRREVTKTAGRVHAVRPARTAASNPSSPQPPGLAAVAAVVPATSGEVAPDLARPIRGKETAEAFFSLHHSNPLFPPKETS